MMPVAGSIANKFLVIKRGRQPPFAGLFIFIFLLTWRIAKYNLAGV
jgi:hypothetical protein